MTKPQKLTTEEARKQFAELLNGSQFRGEHTEITRHGKAAGYLVPPSWYEAQLAEREEVKALRIEVKTLRQEAVELRTAAIAIEKVEPNERPSPRPAQPVIPIAEPERPRELPEPPWPAPLPSAKDRATAVTAIVKWVLDLDENTARHLLDRARKMPSYADEWRMHAESSGPDWAGLMVLHANQGAARKWLDEERTTAE